MKKLDPLGWPLRGWIIDGDYVPLDAGEVHGEVAAAEITRRGDLHEYDRHLSARGVNGPTDYAVEFYGWVRISYDSATMHRLTPEVMRSIGDLFILYGNISVYLMDTGTMHSYFAYAEDLLDGNMGALRKTP